MTNSYLIVWVFSLHDTKILITDCLKVNLAEDIKRRKEKGLFRSRQVIESAQGPIVKINKKDYINFCSNDYLGFANNQALKDCMINAVNEFGIGAGSSQLLVGHSKAHAVLEKQIAEFLSRDAALVFSTGYQANLAIASVLIDPKTIVIQDKYNHASLIDAATLSSGKLVRYAHNDIDKLKALLEKYKNRNLVVMTDGVFSMDGDCASLNDIADLCSTYNAMLIVDDAHGIGVLGETGAGLLEELNLNQDQVPLLIGTFGKAFGASGAFISGRAELIEAFIQKARTYIYTTSLLPSIAATMIMAIELVKNGNHLREHIKKITSYYIALLKQKDLGPSISKTHIQPFIIGDANTTVDLSNKLYENKILASAIRPPTVPNNTSRLRISLTAAHTISQIDILINAIHKASV